MTPRQARRAAERHARKQLRKGLLPVPTTEILDHPEPPPAPLPAEDLGTLPDAAPQLPQPSPARLAANLKNAQRSTGPSSPEGKANSSKNALKTGLTGRTVLLPADDADRYARHLAEYQKIYRPCGERETEIVQILADTWWRLERIPSLEEALYCQGCEEFASRVADLDPQARLPMLRMHTYLAYERQFRNLQLQERRLFSQSEKLQREIKELRAERETREKEDLARAAALYATAKLDHRRFDPAGHGFEFSLADVEAYLYRESAGKSIANAHPNGESTPQARHKAA